VLNELLTHDADAAGSFYTTLFDWAIEPYGDIYTVFMNGDRPGGGLLTLDEADGLPSNWLVYFMVDDCDAVHDRSNSLGGRVQMPPDDWPEVGRPCSSTRRAQPLVRCTCWTHPTEITFPSRSLEPASAMVTGSVL